MRRMLITSLALVATAATLTALPSAAPAKTPMTLTKVRANWFGSTHRIFVDTTWTPKRFATQVTVKISINGESLRTLRVKRWVIGHKLFKLTVPEAMAVGTEARIEVRVRSEAGQDRRAVTLSLNPLDPA
jgi:hypothetical protein